MSDQLSSQQQEEYKTTFSFFDKENKNSLEIQQVSMMMKSLGEALGDGELKAMCKGGSSLDYNTFLQNRQDKWAKEQSGEEVKAAFQAFDPQQTGKVSAEDLKHVMTTMGDVLSAQEADQMIKEAGGGQIDYNAFVDKMKRRT